ncbi:MAG: Hsp20/alpha crystallin family protein [Patescibacteria group bacterium]|nr:Hsp20/alpha crystallin family protein [Patescibacteria group bacterium]
MELIQWKPFDELERLFDGRPLLSFPRLNDMAVDVFEENDNVVAKMSLPAVDANNLDITVDEDVLTISGERKEEKEIDKKDYYSKEIRRGSFSRSVRLPKLVNSAKAEADYKDGVLTVTMPIVKGKETKGVKIAVKK